MENNNVTTEENVKVEESGNVGTQANENKDEVKAVKTYTQEEYNALDKKLKEKYEKKYANIDIAKYNEWVESQKTAEQKQAEQQANYQKALAESEMKDKTIAVLRAGVTSENEDYVLFKVGKMEGDFSENLAKFLQDNPKFLGQELKTEPKATGAPVKSTGSNEVDGVIGILAQKHPNINFN
jgi:hypothetical protein